MNNNRWGYTMHGLEKPMDHVSGNRHYLFILTADLCFDNENIYRTRKNSETFVFKAERTIGIMTEHIVKVGIELIEIF